jgi:homoserine dehydrogenase
MQVVKVGLLGLGTVGQAVAELAQNFGTHAFRIERAAVRDTSKRRHTTVPVTRDPDEIIHDPAIDVVVEVAGGREPARGWIMAALKNGKAVVTANKEVIAYDGPALIAASETNGAYLGFEASVGGGIPILDALRFHLTAAPIQEIFGVLNGTTNYLLGGMAAGRPYRDVLKEAQEAGFAEADPAADVGGYDTLRKLVVLTYLAFGHWLDPDHIVVQGLTDWPPSLFARLKREGMALRLLAVARREPDNSITAQVRPTLVPEGHPLYYLSDAQNGVGIRSAAGHFWLEGPGAGGLATATSIWADVRRSQYTRAPVSAAVSVTRLAPAPVKMPEIAVATDPDRVLSQRYPTSRRFLDPAIAWLPGPQPSQDGILSFPWWDRP